MDKTDSKSEPTSADLVEIFTKARENISSPASWTKLAYARAQYGRAISIDSPAAVCFCGRGSIIREINAWVNEHEQALGKRRARTHDALMYRSARIFDDVVKDLDPRRSPNPLKRFRSYTDGDRYDGFVEYNDHDSTTHAQVLAVFDEAIEKAAVL